MVKAKRIFCVVAYDITDDRCRNKVAKILQQYGVRINFSVFECMFTENQYQKVKQMIASKIDIRDDTIVYYQLCVNCFTKIAYQPERKSRKELVNVV